MISIISLLPTYFEYPKGDEHITSSSILVERCSVSDIQGHSLVYSVFFSYDSGSTCYILVLELTTLSYSWDISNITNGNEFMLMVNATCSEGENVGSTTHSTFTIQKANSSISTSKTMTTTMTNATYSFSFPLVMLVFSLMDICQLLSRKKV